MGRNIINTPEFITVLPLEKDSYYMKLSKSRAIVDTDLGVRVSNRNHRLQLQG